MAAEEQIPTTRRVSARVGTGPDANAIPQRWLLLGVFLVLISLDQVAKWLAWRHIDGTVINAGGFIMLGPVIRFWFAAPVVGAVSDVVGAMIVVAAVYWLAARPRRTSVALGGGLVAAGFASNILDRLGLHNWTAPSSARGVVDFIPNMEPGRYNVADIGIILGLLILGYGIVRTRLAGERHKLDMSDLVRRPSGSSGRILRAAVALVFLAVVTLAVVSAIDSGGVETPLG